MEEEEEDGEEEEEEEGEKELSTFTSGYLTHLSKERNGGYISSFDWTRSSGRIYLHRLSVLPSHACVLHLDVNSVMNWDHIAR